MHRIHLISFLVSLWLLLPMTVAASFMLPVNLTQHEDNLFFFQFNRQQATMTSHLFADKTALIQGATAYGQKCTKEKKMKMRVNHDTQV